jgi:hypothetical protein
VVLACQETPAGRKGEKFKNIRPYLSQMFPANRLEKIFAF